MLLITCAYILSLEAYLNIYILKLLRYHEFAPTIYTTSVTVVLLADLLIHVIDLMLAQHQRISDFKY